MKPLSSTMTMVLLLFPVFFYTRPIPLAPTSDGLSVALASSTLGFPASPAHALEYVPNTGGIVAYPELFSDHLDDPRQGPQLGGIALAVRST